MDKIKLRSEHALAMLAIWYSFALYEKSRPPPNGVLYMKTKGLIAYDRAITRVIN